MDYVALKSELTVDPLSRGYAGMTDAEAAIDLNTVYRERNRISMTGSEVINSIGRPLEKARRRVMKRLLAILMLLFAPAPAGAQSLWMPSGTASVMKPIPNWDVAFYDSDHSHYYPFIMGSDATAVRNITWMFGDSARTVTISGNPTLDNWFDQSVKVAATPTFGALTVSALDVAGFINSSQTVNQTTYPSVNASQTAETLQDGSAFTGTDGTMSTKYQAVQFTASASHTMGDFTIRVKESSNITNVTQYLTGYIYADDGGTPGKPTGSALTTGREIRYGTLTTSYQILSVGTTRTLVSGTKYWLVLRQVSAPTGGNIVLDSDVSSNMGATSADGSTWTNTDVRLRYVIRGLTHYGVRGTSTNSYGIYGTSTNSYGVYGDSTNSYGVRGSSTNSIGVFGNSTNNFGIYGSSTNSTGVRGISTNGYGVYGTSTNSTGIYGTSTTNRAGYFYRSNTAGTATTAVVEIVQDSATSETNTVLRVQGDGTGDLLNIFDGGTEVFTILDGGNTGILTATPDNTFTVAGNASLGDVAVGTNATRTLLFENGTVPADGPANAVQLYAEDETGSSELRVRDEATNVTTLSPHNFTLYEPDAADVLPWSYYTKNDTLGIEQNVDISGVVRAVEALTGKKFIHRKTYTPKSWDANQQANAVAKHKQIEVEVLEKDATETIQVEQTVEITVEVALADAFEAIEITEQVEAGTKTVFTHAENEAGVVEVAVAEVPNMVAQGTGKFRKQLLAGIVFSSADGKFRKAETQTTQVPTLTVKDGFRKDEATGKYYRFKTEAEAIASVTPADKKSPPKWLADRLALAP